MTKNEQNINEIAGLEKELKDYTSKLAFLKSEALRLEGVILYIQNQIDQKSKN